MQKNEGYITLEATLIVSLILFFLQITIMFVFILYQHVLLTNIAVETASRGAEIWMENRQQILYGDQARGAQSVSLYDSFLELFKLDQYEYYCKLNTTGAIEQQSEFGNAWEVEYSMLKSLAKRVGSELSKSAVKPSSTRIWVKYDNGFLKKTLTVKILQDIAVPLGGIKSLFDGKKSITLEGKAYSAIISPTAFIRNVDFGVELAEDAVPLSFDGLLAKVKAVFPGGLQ